MATMAPPAAPPPPMYAPPPMKPSRPIGVAILAILTILFGIIGLVGGLLVLLGGALLATIAPEFGSLFLIIGGLLALFSLLAIVSGIGLWRLRPWAWWLTVIVGVLSIVFNIGSFAVFPGGGFPYGIVLWLIILIYLVVVRKSFMARPMGM